MYYAITGLGWGRGDTPVEAEQTYLRIQRQNFRSLTDEDLAEAWGFVWQAPEGATGFVMDFQIYWQFEDRDPEVATPDQRVHTIGRVPANVINPSR